MWHDTFLCYRADKNADQTITCSQDQQVEHYIDASSSDDEQVESLICAAKKEGLYLGVIRNDSSGRSADRPHIRPAFVTNDT